MNFFDEFLLLLKVGGCMLGLRFELNASSTVLPVAKVISNFASIDFPFKALLKSYSRNEVWCWCYDSITDYK